MNEKQHQDLEKKNLEEQLENSGVRAAEINQNPNISLEEGRNAAEGKGTNAAGGSASSTAEEHVPSSSDPNASDLPSAR
jgi:hypothetical protein